MGTSPKGDTYNHEGIGLPLLNGPTEFGPFHPTPVLFTSASIREARAGDLLFCVRGSTTGRMNWADRSYAVGRGIAAIRAETALDTYFIRYCLEVALPALLKRAGGGTFPNLTQSDLESFTIPWPESRRRVSAVLAAYDELIENNLRRVDILDQMTQAIYREWFVHFRYPGSESRQLVKSAWGLIPEGWEAVEFGSLADSVRSHVHPSKHPQEAFYHFSFAAFDSGKRPVIQLGKELKSGKLRVTTPSVLLAKLNPKIPRVWLVVPRPGRESIASSEFLVLVPRPDVPVALLYGICADSEFGSEIAARAGGTSTSHQRLNLKDLERHLVALAPIELREQFNDLVEPMLALVSKLREANENLRTTRDLLLPRLVLGIDISDLDIDTGWLAG